MRFYRKKRSAEVSVRFGANLARARRRAGLSQEELATGASLHRTEIGMLEHGQRVARINTVIKLSGAMAIEIQSGACCVSATSRSEVVPVETASEGSAGENDRRRRAQPPPQSREVISSPSLLPSSRRWWLPLARINQIE